MWTRKEVKERGKAALKRNYWNAVLVALILGICAGGSGYAGGSSGSNAASSTSGDSGVYADLITDPAIVATVLGIIGVVMLISIVVKIFVFNPLTVGCERFFILNDSEDARPSLNELGYGFKNNYGNIVKIMFLRDLYVFLWSLLFIIPGIVKAYQYLIVPYMLAEDSSISSSEIFITSKDMMNGNKLDAFVLELSFIGWALLAVITCGIVGVFWLNPYFGGAMAAMYANIRDGFGFNKQPVYDV